jgi:ABC-2 type transport system permease protein
VALARRFPIFWLALRQFRDGRAIWVVAFFAAIPIILAGIYLVGPRDTTGGQFLSGICFYLLAPTIVPLATLILATSAFGNLLGDGTLSYLVLKPVSRVRIVLEEFLGVVIVGAVALLIGLVIAFAMVEWGREMDWSALASSLLAAATGILAYGAVFLLLGLMTQRALLVGMLYIVLWENLLARFIAGARFLSVCYLSQSVLVRSLADSPIDLPDAPSLGTAALAVGLVVAVALALTTLRLREMDLD